VNQVFAKAEDCKTPEGSESYAFSQLVGELVSEQFDGMRIPGVRGTSGSRHSNVVVFRPHEEWAYKRLQQDVGEPLGSNFTLVLLVYLWARSQDPADHARNGSGDRRSRLELRELLEAA